MSENTKTRDAERTAYAVLIQTFDDDQFVKQCRDVCWFSAFANNNPHAPAHWQADLLIDESRRREKPWLYARGRNKAIRLCGLEPTERDLEAARASSEASR